MHSKSTVSSQSEHVNRPVWITTFNMASTSTKEIPASPKPASRASVEYLGQRHRDIFTHALSNVLSTPAAELAFAQIIDGAPLSQTANEVRNRILPQDHPVREQHPELCPGVLEKTRDIRTTLDIRVLPFDFQVCVTLYSYIYTDMFLSDALAASAWLPCCITRLGGL